MGRRIRIHELAIAASFVVIMLALPAPTAMAGAIIFGSLCRLRRYSICCHLRRRRSGYYAQKGIRGRNYETIAGAGAAQEAMAAGAADIGELGAERRGDCRCQRVSRSRSSLADRNYAPSGWYLLALANSPIQSVSDLDGKRVAVSSKTARRSSTRFWMANKYGMKSQTVPLGGSEWPALRSGQVEAIIRSSGDAFRLLLGGEVRSILDLEPVMGPNIPECWVATQGDHR